MQIIRVREGFALPESALLDKLERLKLDARIGVSCLMATKRLALL